MFGAVFGFSQSFLLSLNFGGVFMKNRLRSWLERSFSDPLIVAVLIFLLYAFLGYLFGYVSSL